MKNILVVALILLRGLTYAQPKQPEIAEYSIEPVKREPADLMAQPTFESVIVSAFKAGNSSKIASFFSENVDLSIEQVENLYSSSQSEQILKNFFVKNKPEDFVIIHKGKSGSSEYFIGELSANTGKFRVTLNSKTSGGSNVITALTIEKD